MVDRLQSIQSELFGQPIGVDPIPLVSRSRSVLHVTHHYALGVWLQQVVQPLRLGAFLERHMHRPADALDQGNDRLRSVGTVARMWIAPLASRTVATLVAWCTSNARY